ncbi:hypothetical protein [Porphyromonas pogonae]|uniref:hypothetical protein n=1 Tax=Porphyromonas pogonae TaxID=867595 RepID=UPI002E78BF5E|nr:hypothetical protein [Porphyromonas pogonae]
MSTIKKRDEDDFDSVRVVVLDCSTPHQKKLSKKFGSNKTFSLPLHPQTNGSGFRQETPRERKRSLF